MSDKSDRLFEIIAILSDGQIWKAQEIADRLGVSVRTIYRDMDALQGAGVPVDGARGTGYRARAVISLPPLALDPGELNALTLGLAIVAEAADPDLQAAAQSLSDKIDAALPAQAISAHEAWKFEVSPFASAARGASHMALVRAAIKSRQKLAITILDRSGASSTRRIRPLHMQCWGRVWTLTAWCETQNAFAQFRLDLIAQADALPELFVDEPGRTFADYQSTAGPG